MISVTDLNYNGIIGFALYPSPNNELNWKQFISLHKGALEDLQVDYLLDNNPDFIKFCDKTWQRRYWI